MTAGGAMWAPGLRSMKSGGKIMTRRRTWSKGRLFSSTAEGNYISSGSGRLVACLGLRNCLVVDTPDGLLVADLGRSQEIRKVIEELKKRGRDDLL